nr:hypothetical protein BaRGS_030494 [Batillaria attramentaria]
MREVREESDQFQDVLVSDFHDSYNNLTLKTLMGLRWAATRCRHARYTPVEMYPYDLYPPYCSGTTYTGGMGVAERVVGVSKHVPFFHMEDVYVGMCLQAIGYGVRHVEGFLTRGTAIKDKCRMMRPDGIPMITVHRVPPARMTELWAGQCRRNDTN